MSETSNNVKFGDLRKCPYCGAPISGIVTKCPECGHEFSNISANSTISKLTEGLTGIDKTATGGDIVKRKIQFIQNFPVPNTKEDIIEMLTLCRANMDSKAEDPQLRKAWKTKALQMISKSEMMLKGDRDADYLIKSIKEDEGKKHKRTTTIIISILVALAAIGGGYGWYSHNAKAEVTTQSTELTSMKSKIHKLIKEGKYDEAYEQIDEINNYMVVHETEHLDFEEMTGDLYLKLAIALIQDGDLPGAAMVGLDYREKLNDDYKWRHSQIFKVLVQECEAQDYDDSPLR